MSIRITGNNYWVGYLDAAGALGDGNGAHTIVAFVNPISSDTTAESELVSLLNDPNDWLEFTASGEAILLGPGNTLGWRVAATDGQHTFNTGVSITGPTMVALVAGGSGIYNLKYATATQPITSLDNFNLGNVLTGRAALLYVASQGRPNYQYDVGGVAVYNRALSNAELNTLRFIGPTWTRPSSDLLTYFPFRSRLTLSSGTPRRMDGRNSSVNLYYLAAPLTNTDPILASLAPQAQQWGRHHRLIVPYRADAQAITSVGASMTGGSAAAAAPLPITSTANATTGAAAAILAGFTATANSTTSSSNNVTAAAAVATTANNTTSSSNSVTVTRAIAATADSTTSSSNSVTAAAAAATTANNTTTSTNTVTVTRVVATIAGNTTSSSNSVAVTRAVATIADNTTASTNTVTATAVVASTANTTTTGAANASNGIQAAGNTVTGGNATLQAVYPMASIGDSTGGSASRLVAPITSTADSTTSATAAVSAVRAVNSAADCSTGTPVVALQSLAAVSSAGNATTSSPTAVAGYRAVASTGASTTGTAAAVTAARSVSAIADTYTGSFAGVGVLRIASVLSAYAGAANSFTGHIPASISVSFAPTAQPRRHEWPYRPR